MVGAGQVDNATALAEPDSDVLGWENGYWHNESIDVDGSDGLSAAERERVLARTMARVEYLRGLEFEETPRIEFVSRDGVETYVDRNVTQLPGGNQTWEALFVFGEDTDAREAIRETILASVGGMAAEEGVDHVVLVTEDPERPQISGYVLAHELVHVLQDQYFDLSAPRYRRSTLDGELGKDSIVEGEASLVDGRYRRQCASGAWSCLSGGMAPPSGSVTPAVATLMSVPYRDGAIYAATLRERGGWQAVSSVQESPPATVEPVLHPDRVVEPPEPIEYADRSGPDWSRTDDIQRIGEAGVRTLFARQNGSRNVALPRPNGTVSLRQAVTAPAEGWGNDTLYTYTNGSHGGYVWVTEWDSRADAAEFADAYRAVLQSYDPLVFGESTYVIDDGPFADAFHVRHNGTRVMIANAPDRSALNALSDRLDVASTESRHHEGRTVITSTAGPGFGVASILLALVVMAVILLLIEGDRHYR
ncbi:Hvo_1808 family surface protein [Halorhabdus amylolytica]|uniref:Hvo_1808 family surface protein n=1 Tax=Halorhabdus amylolytica TaxID=2559573 RepID=UPI0010AA60B4|nr:Hvo_1808 family surface protein [Halorhabdus amylolytica]